MTPLHPAIVHFPPVLLFAAAILYILGLVLKQSNLDKMGFFFHAAGLLACLAAIFTGDYEADRIPQNAEIHEIVERHEFLVMLATYGFGILGVWAFLRQKSTIAFEKIGFVCAFIALTIVIGIGAHLGGEMVFEHGAGVQPMEKQILEHSYLDNLNSNSDEK